MKMKKNRGIEELKSRYGIMFISPWILGIIVFFLMPIIQSIRYAFSSVTLTSGAVITEFEAFGNFDQILNKDPYYVTYLQESLLSFLYSLPIILMLSLVLAMMLNQKFRGRLFFRALYFLPVIIATGQVIKLIFQTTADDLTEAGVSSSFSSNMLTVEDLTTSLNMDVKIAEYISIVIGKIFDLIWNCGIQTVLFLSGLQSVPRALYEASKVEGATKWEEFWFITFPMLSRVTLLVAIFTMVELIVNERSTIIEAIYGKMKGGAFGEASAMAWFYFLIAGAVMAIVIFLYNRFLMKRWET